MLSGGFFALREMGHFPSRASVMRSKSIPAGSDAGCLIGATANSRANRRGCLVAKKIKGINSAKDCQNQAGSFYDIRLRVNAPGSAIPGRAREALRASD